MLPPLPYKGDGFLPYFSSPSPKQCGSHTKTSAQREQRGKRRKRAGKSISCDVGNGEKSIEEEAEDVCARPHSGIRLFVINEVSKDSMEEDYEDEGNKERDNTKDKNVRRLGHGPGGYA